MPGMRSAAWLFVTVAMAAAPARAEYGALAASDSTADHGWATHAQSQRQAELDALQGCMADDCVIQTLVAPGECIIFARKPDSSWWTWSVREDKEEARKAVVGRCADQGGSKCRVEVDACMQ